LGIKPLSSRFAAAVLLWLTAAPAVWADEGSGWTIVCSTACVAACLGFWIFALFFLYRDAQARGGNGLLWLFLGIVMSPLALLIWLIIRPEKHA
jgi:hypothetical protein